MLGKGHDQADEGPLLRLPAEFADDRLVAPVYPVKGPDANGRGSMAQTTLGFRKTMPDLQGNLQKTLPIPSEYDCAGQVLLMPKSSPA